MKPGLGLKDVAESKQIFPEFDMNVAEEDKGAPGTELAAGESEAAERRGVLVRMIDDSLDDLPWKRWARAYSICRWL